MIITDDLKLISDFILRRLFSKGPKYRLPVKIDFDACRESINGSLDSLIKMWCKRENVKTHSLNSWKFEIMKIIDIRINNFKNHPEKFKQPNCRFINSIKSKISKLHEEFIIALADKASNNVIFI